MKIAWRKETPHLAVLAALFALAAAAWPVAPARMPVHWNLAGEVDRYGSKAEGLLLLPVLACGLYLLQLFLPLADPKRENFVRFESSFAVIRWSLTLFLAALYGLTLAAAFGANVDFPLCLSSMTGVLFIVLGWALSDIEPNWFIGVRTPWTLSSDLSWKKTHRAAKWVFLALGLSFLPLGFWKTAWTLAAVLTVGLGGVAGLFVYSYLVWKRDPQRSVEKRSAVPS